MSVVGSCDGEKARWLEHHVLENEGVHSLGLAEIPENFEQKFPAVRINDGRSQSRRDEMCFRRSVDAAHLTAGEP